MAKFERFEDIVAWQRARRVANRVYDLSSDGPFSKDFGLRDQIRRAAISILSNIAEGFERGGNKEFLQFLSTAKGSAGELRAQLYIALDRKYVQQSVFDELHAEVVEVSRMIGALMGYLRRSKHVGSKFHKLADQTRVMPPKSDESPN